jgi:hypothetical protein
MSKSATAKQGFVADEAVEDRLFVDVMPRGEVQVRLVGNLSVASVVTLLDEMDQAAAGCCWAAPDVPAVAARVVQFKKRCSRYRPSAVFVASVRGRVTAIVHSDGSAASREILASAIHAARLDLFRRCRRI